MSPQAMSPQAMCDVCGQPVDPGEAVSAEVSAKVSMCPTAMTLHPGCSERAAAIWQADDSCAMDPDFPEMAQWAANP